MPAGTAASRLASGVMPAQILGGPVWWYLVRVCVLAIAVAAFCLVDSQLPQRAEQLAGIPEPSLLSPIATGDSLPSS